MQTEFKVNIGHTRTGRERNRYFPTLEIAREVVNDYFRRTKIVLSIVETPKRRQRKAK